VIEGREEIMRMAAAHEVPPFDLFTGDKDAAEDLPA
jgi:hypothetical protein